MKDIYLTEEELNRKIHNFMTRKAHQFEKETRPDFKNYFASQKRLKELYR